MQVRAGVATGVSAGGLTDARFRCGLIGGVFTVAVKEQCLSKMLDFQMGIMIGYEGGRTPILAYANIDEHCSDVQSGETN